jgi:hypothetical protein
VLLETDRYAAAMVNTTFRTMDKMQSASPAPDATLLAVDLAWLPKKNTSNTTIEMIPNRGGQHPLLASAVAGKKRQGT